MNWFEKHAAAVQALASIAGVLTTLILACITYWYVRVTREIARSSAEQVRQMREAARTSQAKNAQALGALAERLRNNLARLNADAPDYHELRAFNQLNETEIAYLETLAWQVGNSEVLIASNQAVAAVREILGFIQEAKGIPRDMGWRLSNQQIESWRRAREESDRSLHAVQNACEQVAG